MSKIAKNMEAFVNAIKQHNQTNPTHTVLGLTLHYFDMERLGIDEGEEVLPGVPINSGQVQVGRFRIVCDGQHDGEEEETRQDVDARSRETVQV